MTNEEGWEGWDEWDRWDEWEWWLAPVVVNDNCLTP